MLRTPNFALFSMLCLLVVCALLANLSHITETLVASDVSAVQKFRTPPTSLKVFENLVVKLTQ